MVRRPDAAHALALPKIPENVWNQIAATPLVFPGSRAGKFPGPPVKPPRQPQLRNQNGSINISGGWLSFRLASLPSRRIIDDPLSLPPTSHHRVSEWFGWASSFA